MTAYEQAIETLHFADSAGHLRQSALYQWREEIDAIEQKISAAIEVMEDRGIPLNHAMLGRLIDTRTLLRDAISTLFGE